MNKSVTSIAWVAFLPFLIWHSSGTRAGGFGQQPDPKRQTKVELKYEKNKNLTTVRLIPLTLWQGLHSSDSVELEISFSYSGHAIVTPKMVRLAIYASDHSGIEFNHESKLVLLVDSLKMDAGRMRQIGRSIETHGEYIVFTFQVLELSMPYDQFKEVGRAREVKIELDDRKFTLSAKQLQTVRDFVELMQQSGQEFK